MARDQQNHSRGPAWSGTHGKPTMAQTKNEKSWFQIFLRDFGCRYERDEKSKKREILGPLQK